MKFKVPQFLEIEDKIFGPFTFKEFVYLVGGGSLCYILYKLLGLLFGVIPIFIIGGLSLMLTFYRPNNKPFIEMLEAFFKYIVQNKLYIWKKEKNNLKKSFKVVNSEENKLINQGGTKLNTSKLRDLAWSLDVLDSNKQKETK